MPDNEKRFEEDIERYLITEGGWEKGSDAGYRVDNMADRAMDVDTLISFVQTTQPAMWSRFEKNCKSDTKLKFYNAVENAIAADGLVRVLKHGFKYRGMEFRICYFKPESSLNKLAISRYESNICQCVRQWHYSNKNNNSVDMALFINGIPLVAIELKDQYTGQSVEDAKLQWMTDRDHRENAFRFNHRILTYFAVDLKEAWMTTKLNGLNTKFLPFNQGSNGAGHNGGAGNPSDNNGDYPTSYLWKKILNRESLLDILQNFISHKVSKDNPKGTIIFPRYHQWDVVMKLEADVLARKECRSYLIQHSAGSGKSNSIAWLAYRMASLHDENNNPVYNSVIIVTDRRVLNTQLQDTIGGFDHQLGAIELIDGLKKGSSDLLKAVNDGKKIIVSTLQRFSVIHEEVDDMKGKKFAIIVDEAHSSQTGQSASNLKKALADTTDALKEYAELEAQEEREIEEKNDRFLQEMVNAGRHSNLTFFAFTATPKDKTLEIFGDEDSAGQFHPFHIYSMKQAIQEGFIMDTLANYTTYQTCYNIAKKNEDENPEVPTAKASKALKRFASAHPYNIERKSAEIVTTFLEVTRKAIDGKGKMMVVTDSRLAAVRYFHAVKEYIRENDCGDILVMIAFSGKVKDPDVPGTEYTEPGLNVDRDGNRVSESQTKDVFNKQGDILIVAEKYQTGFDEPLLHTMIIDKKLRDIKAVQTISRLNRICDKKTDTYVLDFVNTTEEIKKAFQGYYNETILEKEIDVDLIYKTQKELREFKVYGDEDVRRVCDIYIDPASDKDAKATQAKITSALMDVYAEYENLDKQKRYEFRRQVRSFVKWFNYIAQIVRLYDRDLIKEYTLLKYLSHLLPGENTDSWALGNKVRLEYYKLKETFSGSISLEKDVVGIYTPAKEKSGYTLDEKKSSLSEVIDNINAMYDGEFTDADKVVTDMIRKRLRENPDLKASAQEDTRRMFEDSKFPEIYKKVLMELYMESAETFQGIFNDPKKYKVIMEALALALYEEFNS